MNKNVNLRLANFKRKINAALKWAKDNGLKVSSGHWCDGFNSVCPIGAALAQREGIEAVQRLKRAYQSSKDDRHLLYRLGKKIGLTVPDIRDFINGVDGGYDLKGPFGEFGREVSQRCA